jgi:thiamine-monophosphate kinase
MHERALIQLIRRLSGQVPSSRTNGLVVPIGDDCAVWRPRRAWDSIITTDQLVEGVHYLPDAPAAGCGARLVGRGLSDIAAMGGEPRVAFLNVAWAATLPERWRLAFLRGFARELRRYRTGWAGGDVSGTRGPAVASITVIGEVPGGRALLRSGARPGDLLYCSGRLGAASRRITPRLTLGQRLRDLATACMDISDGLSTDLHHLCDESGVGAIVEHTFSDQALNRGEDYELLFTARPTTRIPATLAGVKIIRIGRMTRDHAVLLGDVPLQSRGWEHR